MIEQRQADQGSVPSFRSMVDTHAYLFAGASGQSRQQYAERLLSSEELVSRHLEPFEMTIPVSVPTAEMPLPVMMQLAGINSWCKLDKVRTWGEISQPQEPHVIQAALRQTSGTSIDGVRRSLAPSERGGTLVEGLSLYLAHPGRFKGQMIDLPGTQLDEFSAVSLARHLGSPIFFAAPTQGVFLDTEALTVKAQ